MKILVLGSKGQLGLCLTGELLLTQHDVNLASHIEINICDFDGTKERIALINPDVVINATAYTAVDKAEDDRVAAYLVNHIAVSNLADICNEFKCWLIHVSTDYVFDGRSTRAYVETDGTNPQSVYGMSKLKGEEAIKASGSKFLIIRTAWVFSEFGNNFLKTMVRLGGENNRLNVVGDQIGCPTYARDIAKAIVCVLPFLSLDQESGTYNYAGNKACSWVEFAKQIFQEAINVGEMNDIPEVLSITSKEYPTPAVRPMNSRLDSSRFEAKFGYKASDWKVGIRETLKYLKSNKRAQRNSNDR